MPEETLSTIQGEGGGRSLKLGAVRVHNDHLSSGIRTAPRCPVCTEGLGGVVAKVAAPRPKVVVAKSDGADEEGGAASSSDDGSDIGDDQYALPWA